ITQQPHFERFLQQDLSQRAAYAESTEDLHRLFGLSV
ncbi:MAG: hypothetical protein QG638_1568, partial [Pseudomonadota bacterium]|nr:hypothetical protein [Pseudomonadota bacterium]